MRLLAIIAVASGCSSPAPTDALDTFLAFNSTFADFRTWTSFHSDGPADDGTYPPDVLGPRTQYINKLPPAGSTLFPTGTVIVEARESGTMHILAAVKRGGGFNASGALNWEWFELNEDPTTKAVTYLWRGVGPPAGDIYGGDPNGGCNACHAACGKSNDYVCSAKLQLPDL